MNWQKEVAEFKSKLKVCEPGQGATFMRCGFFGLVGGGKSVTAGVLAVSITPSTDLIGWIDGEGRRSKYAIDQVAELAAAHYGKPKQSFIDRIKVIHVDPPYNPLVGVAAIEALEEQGCKTIIADLCSQLWDSDGGYLDMREEEIDKMAGNQDNRRQRVASAATAHVKRWTHGKFVNKVNSCNANIVLVFQAKAKWNAATNKIDEFVSPIQESGLTRTALAVGCVEANQSGVGGYCKFQMPLGQGTKYTHPGILKCLPKNGEQFTFQHGEALAKWCANPGTVSAGSLPAHPAGGGSPSIPQPAAGTQLPLDPAKPKAEKPAQATDKTRSWMLEELLKIHTEEILIAYAIDKALILPVGETLRDWPLTKVPTTRFGLAELSGDIDAWRGK